MIKEHARSWLHLCASCTLRYGFLLPSIAGKIERSWGCENSFCKGWGNGFIGIWREWEKYEKVEFVVGYWGALNCILNESEALVERKLTLLCAFLDRDRAADIWAGFGLSQSSGNCFFGLWAFPIPRSAERSSRALFLHLAEQAGSVRLRFDDFFSHLHVGF